MSTGSGLAHQLGFVPEVTYGTYVAPTKFVEVQSTGIEKVKNTYQGGGLAAGRLVRLGSRRYVTSRAGAGPISMEVHSKTMGHLLNGLMGGTVAPVQQGATAAYLQTHALADPFGKFYTFQGGVPDLAGTVRPYSFVGSKILSAEFSCGLDESLMATFNIDSRDVSEAQALAAASYAAGVNSFHFAQAAVKLGTFGAEASVDGVRRLSLTIERGSRTDRFYQGNAGLKSEPVINAWAAITGTVEVDYIDKTVFADRFASDAPTSLVWEFIGPAIPSGGGAFETFRIRCPQIFFNGSTPTVGGPDIVTTSFAFEAQFDGTNAAATIEYMSTDTTL